MTSRQLLFWQIMVAVIGLALSSLIIFGALKMMRRQAYWVAIVAAVLAMLVTPGSLIGLPIGIWALVVLSGRPAREAFRAPGIGRAEPAS